MAGPSVQTIFVRGMCGDNRTLRNEIVTFALEKRGRRQNDNAKADFRLRGPLKSALSAAGRRELAA